MNDRPLSPTAAIRIRARIGVRPFPPPRMPDFLQKVRSSIGDSPAFQRASAFARRGNTPWLLVALGVGFVLFLLMWGHTRKQFFTVEPVAKSEPGQEYTPLPAPTPGSSITSLPADDGTSTSAGKPRLLEPPKPPPVSKAPVSEDPADTTADAPAVNHGAATTNAAITPAVLISRPPMEYPRSASGEGRVRVRIEIGADGVPTDSSIIESSGDPELDRAALRSVRRWRFKPALSHGVPVASNATAPIEFKLSQ